MWLAEEVHAGPVIEVDRRQQAGMARIQRHRRKFGPVEGGIAVGRAEHLVGRPVAQIGCHGDAGAAITQGIVDAVAAADMGHIAPGIGDMTAPAMADPDRRQIGEQVDQIAEQTPAGAARWWASSPFEVSNYCRATSSL